MRIFDKCEDTGRLVLRLMIGVLLLFHGIAKAKGGVDWMTPMLAAHHLPGFIGYGVYIGEIVAPILLVIGVFTRPAGAIIAFNMVMAVLLVRLGDIAKLSERSGGWAIELEALFALGGIAVYCLGSGKYALSRGRGKWD
jgi:putative oxidoreductase